MTHPGRTRSSRFIAILAMATLLALALASAASAAERRPVRGGAEQASVDLHIKSPWLIWDGVPSHMRVMWQLSTSWTSVVQWGTDSSYALGSVSVTPYTVDNICTYTITGLAPGTRYLYRVTSYGATHGGAFTTPPAPGVKNLKLFAYGDTRTYPATHDAVARRLNDVWKADSTYQTMSLFMGDFVTTGTSESDWATTYFSPSYPNIKQLLNNLPLLSCIGNHEGVDTLYLKYFPYSYVAGRYWSFDYGPVHVAVLDQYMDYTAGSPQMQWLAADLAASEKTWKFLVFHEPGWSAGGGHPNLAQVQTVIEPLAEQYGVAIVFNGHNHYYARCVVNGIQHVTTGGGGAPLQTPDLSQPNLVFAQSVNQFCTLDIQGGTLRFKAINSAGAAIDSFTLVRPCYVTPPAVALTAPVAGAHWDRATTQTITWVATDSAGVDSVNVEYSLHGPLGPWRDIARGIANTGSVSWDLPDTLTDDAFVRVAAFDHALNSASALSDVLHIQEPALGVGPDGAHVLRLAPPHPNPGMGSVSLAFTLPRAGEARLEIIDTAGRRVWSARGAFGAGPRECRWDGRADGGAAVGSGLYFVRLTTPWGARSQRLVWMR